MRTIRDVMNMSVKDLDFSVRCTNCMKNNSIETLSQLTARRRDEIAKSRNVGKKSLEEIDGKLDEIGLSWEMDDRAWLSWGLTHIDWIKRH